MLFVWGVMYFVFGVFMVLLIIIVGFIVLVGIFVYNSLEYFVCCIDGFLNFEIDLCM